MLAFAANVRKKKNANLPDTALSELETLSHKNVPSRTLLISYEVVARWWLCRRAICYCKQVPVEFILIVFHRPNL